MDAELKREILALASSVLILHILEHHKDLDREEFRLWYSKVMTDLMMITDSPKANEILEKIAKAKSKN